MKRSDPWSRTAAAALALCFAGLSACASSKTAPKAAAPAPGTSAEAAESTSRAESSRLFERFARYAALYPADTYLSAVALVASNDEPTLLDKALGLAPLDGGEAAKPSVTAIRSDVVAFFDLRLGFRPTEADTLILAIGKTNATIVVEGEVEYGAAPETVEIDGHELMRVETHALGFGPLWGVKISDAQAVAYFLSQDRALAAARSRAGQKPDESLADTEQLATFGKLYANSDGHLGIAALLDGKRTKAQFRHLVFDPLDIYAPNPDQFALTLGRELQFSFWGSRKVIGEIERVIDERARDARNELNQDNLLAHAPLLLSSVIIPQIAVIDAYLAHLKPRLTTESLSYAIPLGNVDSQRAVLGLVALHATYVAHRSIPPGAEFAAYNARRWVDTLAEDAADYFRQEVDGAPRCTFPSLAPIPASGTCCPSAEQRDEGFPVCSAAPDAWEADWIGRNPGQNDRQFFVYQLESNGKKGADARAVVRAHADYRCDGKPNHTITLELRGVLKDDGTCDVEQLDDPTATHAYD